MGAQEDYVKWKGPLFYRFVTAVVDESAEVREFGRPSASPPRPRRNGSRLTPSRPGGRGRGGVRACVRGWCPSTASFCLVQVLLSKYPLMFYSNFQECLYILNGVQPTRGEHSLRGAHEGAASGVALTWGDVRDRGAARRRSSRNRHGAADDRCGPSRV